MPDAPGIARALGVERVTVKNEADRLGLPAFKVLGASWATYRVLLDRLGANIDDQISLDGLRERLAALPPVKLVAATDGNHGRAVARMAALLDMSAEIFVPADMVPARRQAIASEGATVTVVEGSYDDAVNRAAGEASDWCMVIADTAWPGYLDVPKWVVEGYATILWEVDDELAKRGVAAPDVVAVQIGVGAFAGSVAGYLRATHCDNPPTIIGVEPLAAACVLESIEAGDIVTVPGPHRSIMAGLNAGKPSLATWSTMKAGIDCFIAIEDEWARRAMRLLAGDGIVAGESGAAGLAGLLALVSAGETLPPSSHVLVFNTEGATDPARYREIVDQPSHPAS